MFNFNFWLVMESSPGSDVLGLIAQNQNYALAISCCSSANVRMMVWTCDVVNRCIKLL